MAVRLLRRVIRAEPVKYCPVLIEKWKFNGISVEKIGVGEGVNSN